MQDFRNLKVWEKAHLLALAVYRATGGFPKQEAYGLTSQIRRSAMSIPSNIAEGCGRTGDRELVRFLRIASGSASELEYQIILAGDLSYLDAELQDKLMKQVQEVKRMLASLLASFREHREASRCTTDRSPDQPTDELTN